jgi:hypothetical protein
MRKTILSIGTALLAASSAWCGAAVADSVIYVCTSNAHEGAVFVKLDEQLKTASMGRGETTMFVPDPAIFDRDTVTWSHPVGNGLHWSYSFDRATGVLSYGPADRRDLIQQDLCKQK